MSRLYRVRVIAITLFALLFAQWSVAAYACPSIEAQQAVSMPAGCEEMARALDQDAPNLCAAHCHYGEQSDQPRPPGTPAMSLVALYALPTALAVPAPVRSAFEVDGRLIAPSPPPIILHCRLLI
ncbi:MAG: hypothetical protein ACRECQ_10490 [Burkholderiaceae bacterium]